jgi:two-component system, sensor histidine kinase and response regulator
MTRDALLQNAPGAQGAEANGQRLHGVDAELLQMSYARLPLSLLLTTAVVLAFVGLLWPFFPKPQLSAWLAALLFGVLVRAVLWWCYQRAARLPAALGFWATLFTSGAAVGGLAWAFGPIVLVHAARGPELAIFVGALLCVCSVALNAMAGHPPAMQAFITACLAPTAAAFWWTGRDVEQVVALVLLAGLLTVSLVGRRNGQAIRDQLAVQLQLRTAVEVARVAREQAEAASLAKSRFLANMSHELRTPLNAVIGAAQLLRAGPADPERQAHLTDAIQRGGANLLGLIENILDLSRIEAGEMPLHAADFHLVECVESALSTATLVANAKGLRLACIVEPELPAWRHGDAARLRQVMLNLLGNAVKFTPQGEVTVRVRQGRAPLSVHFSVSDTGVGIGVASLTHVFEPFRQADDGANRRFGGSGLGLAIVHQLVGAMRGRVEATSVLGQGSCFEFELPLPLALQAPTEALALPHRVAFVEPHAASAEALSAHLQRLGCEAMHCTSALQLREWLLQLGAGPAPWLLIAVDASDATDTMEPVADLIDPQRVIGMSSRVTHDADQAREGLRLSRQIIKPVTRAALVSRMAAPPAVASAPECADPALLTPAQLAGLVHVLVVEDDELNRSIVGGLLQHAGYRVSQAVDGTQALAILPGLDRVDVVLMDWQMPELDGLEVTRRMRAGAAGPAGVTVPIVALTANAFAEDRAACLQAGMNDFLTKPVLADRLMSTVQRWARHGAAATQAYSVAPAAGPDAACFDPSVLAALPMVADGTDPAFATRVLQMYLDGSRESVAELDAAFTRGDSATAQRCLHTLHSTSAQVGAVWVARQAKTAETALRQGKPAPADVAERLRRGLAEFTRAVAAHRAAAPQERRT